MWTKVVSFNFKEPTFVHKNCINIIENRFKEPSIRLFFTERTTFSSFDTDTAYIELISYRLFASEYNYSLNLCFANRRNDNQTTKIHSATYKFIQTLSSMHPYENPVLR